MLLKIRAGMLLKIRAGTFRKQKLSVTASAYYCFEHLHDLFMLESCELECENLKFEQVKFGL